MFPKFILPIAFPALMGTAIAFFIGFSNNQAYNRWWEARIIWGGLYNDARIWTRTLLAHCNNKNLAEQMILRNIAFVYATADLLRSEKHDNYLKYCNQQDLAKLDLTHNIPNSLLNLQAHDLEQLRQSRAIDGFVFQELHELLINLGSGLGKSERIHYTIFPTTYVFFTELFIWLFIGLITMSISHNVGNMSIILGWIMGFVFNVIHLNGMRLMDPFKEKFLGVPIYTIARNIEIEILQSLGKTNLPKPLLAINNEYLI